MTDIEYRLMPPYGKFSIQEFTWTKKVQGVLVLLPMKAQDYVEFYVDGKLLKEDLHYRRVIEKEARGLLWEDSFDCPEKGWALVKVYKRATD